jgi:DNA-binding transcriptional MerR regulator
MDKSVLKIGELATRSGLTVRALHHYDSIGLLTPSARADSGYRLYNSADVARLHQIQALRKFGMSLANIATFLASPEAPFADIVAQQIAALDHQIQQASVLREQLNRLQQQMSGDGDPSLEDWLGTLEHMKLYEQYFTPDELRRLPFWQQDARRNAKWRAMSAELKSLMARGVPPEDPLSQALAREWQQLIRSRIGNSPDLQSRIDLAHDNEPELLKGTWISQDMVTYIRQAVAACESV